MSKWMTAEELAEKENVGKRQVYTWGRTGIVERKKVHKQTIGQSGRPLQYVYRKRQDAPAAKKEEPGPPPIELKANGANGVAVHASEQEFTEEIPKGPRVEAVEGFYQMPAPVPKVKRHHFSVAEAPGSVVKSAVLITIAKLALEGKLGHKEAFRALLALLGDE